jgi:glutaredoxin
MRKILMIMAAFALFFTWIPTVQAAEQLDAVFFHGQGCQHCAKSESLFEKLEAVHPELEVHRYEVYFNDENRDLMFDYGRIFDAEVEGVPMIFISNQVITGHKPDELTDLVERCLEIGCPSTLDLYAAAIAEEAGSNGNEPTGSKDEPSEALKKLTIPAVISAAAVDAINPCAFAVLILLITAVLSGGSRRRAAMAGFAFIASIFISYFLMGLGLYSAIAAAGISRTFYIVIAVLAIFIGLFNLKDYLWYGKWFGRYSSDCSTSRTICGTGSGSSWKYR